MHIWGRLLRIIPFEKVGGGSRDTCKKSGGRGGVENVKSGGRGVDDDGDNASDLPESGGGGWVEICKSGGTGGPKIFPTATPRPFQME